MPRPLLLLALLASASAAAAPAAAQQAAPPIVAIVIPDSIADFAFHSRYDFDDPNDGVSVRYVGPDSLFADVIVYPGPDLGSDCDRACALQVMDSEIAGFESSFGEFIQRGHMEAMSIQRTDTLEPAPGEPWVIGRHLTLAVRRDNEPKRSDFRLLYLPHYRIKVRVTYAPTVARSAAMLDFYESLIPEMTAAPQVAEEDEDDEGHIGISVTLAGRRAEVARQVEAALRQLGYTVAVANAGGGRITTAVRRIGTDEEGAALPAPIGMTVSVELTAAGDSTNVAVSAISPDRNGPSRATARRMELTTTIMVAGALSPGARNEP